MKKTILIAIAALLTINVWGQVDWVIDTDKIYYNGGNVGIGTTSPNQFLDVVGPAIELGHTETDAINTYSRILSKHYTKSEEPITLLMGAASTGVNDVRIGGGTSIGNAATKITFYTEENSTTVMGTPKMTLKNKFLGIGTTAPITLLNIDGNGGVPVADFQTLTAESGLVLSSVSSSENGGLNTTTRLFAGIGSSTYTWFQAFNSTEAKNISLNPVGGNIGIGTTDPNFKLEIVSDGGILALKNETQSMSEDGLTNTLKGLDKDNNIIWYLGDGSSTKRVLLSARGDGSYPLDFEVNLQTRMRIATNGYVGIGNNSPTQPLNVEANFIGFPVNSGTIQDNGIYRIESSQTGVVLDFGLHGGDDACSWIQSTYKTDLSKEYRLLLNPNGGQVAIGTTVIPSGYLFAVDGKAIFEEVKVEIIDGADLVFEEDYKLRKLDDLEKFVNTNKHLPEIASEKEMQENGVDMGEFQIQLLQKIEELTLYVIELKKENEAQKLFNTELLERIEQNNH
jgi:hypothetical protein